MRQVTPFVIALALIFAVTCAAQPPEPPQPPDFDIPEPPTIAEGDRSPDTNIAIGLIETAKTHLAKIHLMIEARELTPQEQEDVERAHAVGALLGIEGRNFRGTLRDAAARRGPIQEAVRDIEAGNADAAIEGLSAAVAELPDAKILHALLVRAYSAAGDEAQAFEHRALSMGAIPPEDLIFVTLINSVEPEGEADQDDDTLRMPSEAQEPCVATTARGAAAALLAGRDEKAEEFLEQARRTDISEATRAELAAAALVELGSAALPVLEEAEDFTGRKEIEESIMLAGIAACDGRWVEGALSRLSEAEVMAPEGESGDILQAMHSLAQTVLSLSEGRTADIATVAEKYDLQLVKAYLQR
ncbi:MAG: hypothetical protein ACLFWB_10120 [Armatimonadota bacterium]